jgi:cation diffusion facilitator CzcD-associated flavoprotein CzcO
MILLHMSLTIAVVGAGQAGLAVGYYLRRAGLLQHTTIFDAENHPGGAWQHAWPSLTLFSPRDASSLPGMLFPPTVHEYPARDETIAYLKTYEERYQLPVERPVFIESVRAAAKGFVLTTSRGERHATVVIGCTGTWRNPIIPSIPGTELFRGTIMHSGHYHGPEPLIGKRVIVVGGGNSGAQIYADLADHANVQWAVLHEPRYLPDDVDGRILFDAATMRRMALESGQGASTAASVSLGDVVMVDSVRRMRDAGRLRPVAMFEAFTPTGVRWSNGAEADVDVVIFATGFRPALEPFAPLQLADASGRIAMRDTAAEKYPGLYLVGYGGWTGYASATLIGVGRTAKWTVDDVLRFAGR